MCAVEGTHDRITSTPRFAPEQKRTASGLCCLFTNSRNACSVFGVQYVDASEPCAVIAMVRDRGKSVSESHRDNWVSSRDPDLVLSPTRTRNAEVDNPSRVSEKLQK